MAWYSIGKHLRSNMSPSTTFLALCRAWVIGLLSPLSLPLRSSPGRSCPLFSYHVVLHEGSGGMIRCTRARPRPSYCTVVTSYTSAPQTASKDLEWHGWIPGHGLAHEACRNAPALFAANRIRSGVEPAKRNGKSKSGPNRGFSCLPMNFAPVNILRPLLFLLRFSNTIARDLPRYLSGCKAGKAGMARLRSVLVVPSSPCQTTA